MAEFDVNEKIAFLWSQNPYAVQICEKNTKRVIDLKRFIVQQCKSFVDHEIMTGFETQ